MINTSTQANDAPNRTAKSENTTYKDGAIVSNAQVHGEPAVIRLTDEELKSGVTNADTIQDCLKYYHRDGFVVLENAIPDKLVDRLYQKMVQDNEKFLSLPNRSWNQNATIKNISQIPPLSEEWLSKEIYANVHTIRVVENLLGPMPELRFINSNVAVPGATTRQAVHADAFHAFPDFPFGIVVNIYLCDTFPENGSTEVWLGTHEHAKRDQHVSPGSAWIKEEYFNIRAKQRPPIQPTLRKGSICLRDLRLWHAGMPNLTDKPRIMLAIDYFSQWYRCPMPLQLPLSMKSMIEREWKGISTAGIEWVDGDIDHLSTPFFLNLTQDPSEYMLFTKNGTENRKTRETGEYSFDKPKVTEHNYWTSQ